MAASVPIPHGQAHPAEEERRQLSESLAQKHVFAAGTRKARRKLSVGQRSGQTQQPRQTPHCEHPWCSDDLLGDNGGTNVDPGPDHRAHYNRQRMEAAQAAPQPSSVTALAGASATFDMIDPPALAGPSSRIEARGLL